MFLVVVSTLAVSAALANDPNTTEEKSPDVYARNAWKEIRGDLSNIVERLCKRDSLPAPSMWHPMREDKESNDRRINKLMDEALSHLMIGKLSEYRKEYASLNAKIVKDRELMGQQMEKMVAAPKKTGMVSGLWTTSRDEYEKRIEELKLEIQNCENQQKKITEEMRKELVDMGISVDQDYVTNLLMHVSGDTFFELTACFNNVRQLTDIIAGLIADNENYVQNAQKYYGMYVSLLGILLYANERAHVNIREEYTPKIQDVIMKAERTRENTQNLIKTHKGSRDALIRLQQNLDVQGIVITAGNLYDKNLREQLVKLEKAEAELQRRREVALNTYETIKVASTMLSIMKKNIEDMVAIQNMQLPDMVPLQTEEIRLQFQQISEQLRMAR
jgi:hypothetical protein